MKRKVRRPVIADGLKWCRSCMQWLPLSSFGSNKQNKHGLASYCRSCVALKKQELRTKRSEANLCIVCGKPSDGHMRCKDCRYRGSVAALERIEERWKKHLCLRCGISLPEEYEGVRCLVCLETARRYNQAHVLDRLQRGVCAECGAPRDPDKRLCPSCMSSRVKSAKARTDKAREQGICTRCLSKPADPGFRRCSECRAKTAALEASRKKGKQHGR